MIKCDKCGFGHNTVEELRACKSWEEMQAEELAGQDAGSPCPHGRTGWWCQACHNEAVVTKMNTQDAGSQEKPDAQPIGKLLNLIKTWMETESGPHAKFSNPDLNVQVTIKGYKKLILERTFPKAAKS